MRFGAKRVAEKYNPSGRDDANQGRDCGLHVFRSFAFTIPAFRSAWHKIPVVNGDVRTATGNYTRFVQRMAKGLLLGAGIGLFGGLFGLSAYGVGIERSIALGWLFRVRGPIAPPPEIVIIAIDGTTGAKLGLDSLPRNWPRLTHARLIDGLVDYGVSVVAIDLFFREKSQTRDDRELADAVARARRVVLLQYIAGKQDSFTDDVGDPLGDIWIEKLYSPAPLLARAARGMGPFPLPKNDVLLHQFWVFKGGAQEIPTLPAVALQVHAFAVYDSFYRLLDRSGVTRATTIPETAAAVSGAEELRQLMTGIREALKSDPELRRRLESELTQSWLQRETPPGRNLLEALVAMYIGPNERYLNFYGPAGTVRRLPYETLIGGEESAPNRNASSLANKIALVGYADLHDPSQPDRFYTIFTNDAGVDLSGVEIAATALGNLLYDESLRPADGLETFSILFACGLGLTLLLYLAPAVLGIPASALLVAGYTYHAMTSFNDEFLWLPLATPVLILYPVALFIGLVTQYSMQRRKVRDISDALRYFVPEEVSRALISENFKPEDVDRVTFSTCLATDMQGFVSIGDRLPPGELAEFLNDYFDALAKPLRDQEVTVTEFRADAIMCAWTGPSSDPAIRRKPILASLQAAAALEDFKRRHAVFKAPLRIGLQCGEVYVGHSGGGGYFGYSIVGDCANAASRIEALNKELGTQILAGELVTEGIDDLLLRPLGNFIFSGKSDPLAVVEILGLADEATRRQRAICEQFGRGLDYFRGARWRQAAEVFGSVLERFGQDGPSRFYLSLSREWMRSPPVAEHAQPVVVADK